MWLALMVLGLGACEGFSDHHATSQCDQSGVLFVRWTFAGQAPSATSCVGVDHLDVSLTPDDYHCPQATISPVECPLTRFRYDNVPSGINHIDITAYDKNGVPTAQGAGADLLSSTVDQPVAIDLN